jgi:hypothetical protein
MSGQGMHLLRCTTVGCCVLLTLPLRPDTSYALGKRPDTFGVGEMTEDEYVTIMRAAKLCGVSDKTIQRAIRRGILPAQYPQPNRCEIAVSDLKLIRPGQVSGHETEALESRVAELELRVSDLEQRIRSLMASQASSNKHRITKVKERTTGPLPRHLVTLLAFAGQHNVSESKVLAAVEMGLLPVKRGEWRDHDGSVVTLALDPAGKRAFHQIYHGVPPFVACEQCPH